MPGYPIDAGSPDSVRGVARVAGVFTATVAGIVLAGWLFDIAPAREMFSAANPMRPITAFTLVLAGASLWLLSRPATRRWMRVAGWAAGLAVAGVGLLTIGEYVLGVDLWIDDLIGGAGDLPFAHPGRMAPITALAFLLLGSGLAVTDLRLRGSGWVASVLAVPTAIVAYVAILGFAFDVEELRTFGSPTPIAAPTAVLLSVASIGLIAARPDRGLARLFGGRGTGAFIARRVVPAALVLLPLVALLRDVGERAGLYSHAAADVIYMVVAAVALAALLAWTARAIDRVDAERREALDRLDRFFTVSEDMLVVVDAEGRFTKVGDAASRIIGRAPHEVVGVPFLDLVHPDDRERTAEEFRREIAERHTTLDFQNRYLLPDGSVRWLEWSAVADLERGVVYGVARDVTERREAQTAIAAAQEEAEAANLAKTEFLARMSHELRTPLNAIIGFAQLLELDELRPPQQEAVRHVLAAGRHLLELINDVLDISRIEAGQMRISPEPIALAEAMDDAIAMAAPLARERGIEISVGDMPESWFVLADRQRLVQVLLNLLSNAVKYNRAGGRVTVTADDPDAGRIRVSVADEGPGIDAAMHDRLFQPFDRLGAETGAVEGTGLGLSLTKALLTHMGGSLGLAGRPEGGTTFWFELPVPTEEETAAIAAPGTPASGPLAPAGLGVILHIEDNPSNLRLVERALERRPGVRVIPAMLGRLGQELARLHRPDLILLDLQLPDVAGEVLFARLRADPATSRIPVAILSADTSDAHRQRLLDAGARAYLSKPVDLQALFALVDESVGAVGPDGSRGAG